jgi:hypothetical protein
VYSHIAQSSRIEIDALLDVGVDDFDVHHGDNDTQSMEVGRDIHNIHSSKGGVENMEFCKDIGGIDESKGDAMGIQIHGRIVCSQLFAGITNIFTSHVIEDVNATQRRQASIVVVASLRASPIVNKSIQASLDIVDLMFNDTYEIPSSVVEEIAQTSFIDRWEG